MLVLKHVVYEITKRGQLESLMSHLKTTTSKVDGITFNDICFRKYKKEFILFLECESEERYLEWREICPPPPGAKDWNEVLMSKDEHFS